MGKKVDIDAVIADIESAIAKHGVTADVAEWIAEAESLAKTVTIAELNRLCDVHDGVPFIVENEYMPECLGCVENEGDGPTLWLFAKEEGDTYKIFVQCSDCKARATENIPFRICGKERAVTTIAIYLREKADDLFERAAARLQYNLNPELRD